jgi:acyl-CoA reductase-like NAD-dependent aldehyde dehydrogenase
MTLPHFTLLTTATSQPGEPLTVVAPFDDTPIATVDQSTAEIVEQALATAQKLFLNRDAWLPLAKRIEILERVAVIMTERIETLALEAAREGGKPLVDSRVEANRAIDGIKLCIETLRTDQGSVIPMRATAGAAQRIAFTQKEPIGVVVALSAFNHPLNLIVHQVAAAVASGCPVIVKPASNTPLSCLRLVKIFYEAGLPPAWCQALVMANNALATSLATDARVAFLSFIGSAKVGWHLRSQLAPGTRCALEHGGVAPVIVAEDANIAMTVASLLKGGFYHAGQVCVSVQRVYVHQAIAKKLAAALAKAAKALVVGDPTLATTAVGPLISPREVDRIDTWVQEAVAAGAELLCGGERISSTCYACTVLYNPPPQAKVSTEEVFGPVICIYPYQNVDEAIARANGLPFAFQAAVFTEGIDVALRVYERIQASAVMVNDHTAFRVDGMPFAGLKQSGLGTGGIPYTMHDMQVDKLMVIKSQEIL